jgi:hypothetical protein
VLEDVRGFAKYNHQDTKSVVGAPEPLFMVPFPRNADFVGRKDTLDQLEVLLSPEGDDQRGLLCADSVGSSEMP